MKFVDTSFPARPATPIEEKTDMASIMGVAQCREAEGDLNTLSIFLAGIVPHAFIY